MKSVRNWVLGIFVSVYLLAVGAPPASADDTALRASAARAFAGILLAVDAQSDFNAAPARSDRAEMREAAYDILLGLAGAKFWLVVLSKDVTASTHTPAIDADLDDLRDVVGKALDRVDDLLYGDDPDGLSAELGSDASADAFTGLQAHGRRILDALFPI